MADVMAKPGMLQGALIPASLVPSAIDEMPAVFAAAACAMGETVIEGAGELRLKESDRIAAMVSGLRKLGVDCEETPDGARIRGGRILGGEIDCEGDHRVAMAFAVLGLVAKGPVVIRDVDCVDTSFPGFAITSATGSAPEVRRAAICNMPPMASIIRRKPVRVEFTPTAPTWSSRGPISPASIRNAAEEKSPGTSIRVARNGCLPIRQVRPLVRSIDIPKLGSIRSVWSRVGTGSLTQVSPRAPRPASNIADFTCALATGSSYETPVIPELAAMLNGGRPSSPSASMRAPIRARGSMIRRMGRRLSESSPCSSADTP